MGLDPRGLQDIYANYWDLVKNHTEIIHQHAVQNPNQFGGYSASCWGLTASYSRNTDGSTGYAVHQPNNDLGIISPTAALSSLVYTPQKSLDFLRYLYEDTQGAYIGLLGPYDAISPHYLWKTERYLAIDQGTIGPMLENYKSQLFWNLFMNAPEIQQGLQSLGFTSTQHDLSNPPENVGVNKIRIFPNPTANMITIQAPSTTVGSYYQISDNLGRIVLTGGIESESTFIDISGLPSGVYYICVNNQARKHKIIKM